VRDRRRQGGDDRLVGERGSALMLVPAGILVVLLLASLAVDSSVVFLAQRDLADRTAAVANDVANAAADDAALYGAAAADGGVGGGRRVALRPDVAEAYVALAFDPARPPAGYDAWGASVEVDGPAVTVSATAVVRPIFAGAIPGVAHSVTVRARSTAAAVEGGAPG
jgi:hypothetical protein